MNPFVARGRPSKPSGRLAPASPMAEEPERPGAARSREHALADTLAGSDDEVLELPPGVAIGRYVVLDRIGAGAMGVVYAAHDSELDRKIALKLVRDPSRGRHARLMREAHALAKLSQPHVVTVYDVGTYRDQVFIAMELVDGPTLRTWLNQKPRTWREVLDAYLQAGEGLAAAHAAGVVHRDFKPDNVLIDEKGRVRVGDFGLAVLDAATDGPGVGSGVPAMGSPALTRSGAVIGTPAYMAPEQQTGVAADARADQFSFCVALHEGLHGERPFAGESLQEIAEQVALGEIRPLPRDRRVPAWLRRVIARGLACRVDDRYPSMDALLSELRRAPATRRRIAAGAGILALCAAVGALFLAQPDEPVCRGAADKLAGAWDPPRKREVKAAFRGSGAPGADRAWVAVESSLDRYTKGWSAMYTDSCEATHVRRVQAAAILDLRTRCLDQRLAELRALTEVLSSADAAVVQNATRAAGSLTSVEPCADAASLGQVVPPPADAAGRARVDQLNQRLARARALMMTGKYRDGLELAAPLAAEARSFGYRPVEADVLVILGRLQRQSEAMPQAEETLHDAIAAGQAGRNGRATVNAWLELIWLVGVVQARYDEAHRLARIARAAIQRLGPHPGSGHWEMNLESTIGTLYLDQGKLDEARPHLERALSVGQKIHGADSDQIVGPLNSLANLEQYLGKHEAALAFYRRARQILEKLHGAEHPQALSLLGQEASVLSDMGRREEALRVFERGLPVVEKVWGPHSNNTGFYLLYIGDLKRLGKDHAGSRKALERAVVVMEKLHGPDHPQTGRAHARLGQLFIDMKKENEARSRFERAAAVYERALGPDHPDLAGALEGVAEAEIGAGRPKRAIAPLQRALAIRTRSKGAPREPAFTRYLLARAFRRSGGRKAQVEKLLRAARAGFEAAEEQEAVVEIDRWLRSPRLVEPPGR